MDRSSNWYSQQLEIEIMQGIESLENMQHDFTLEKIEYDADKQYINIDIKIPRKDYNRIFKSKNENESRLIKLYLRKEILDNFSNKIMVNPVKCKLSVRGGFFQGYQELYNGEIHNRSYNYARY